MIQLSYRAIIMVGVSVLAAHLTFLSAIGSAQSLGDIAKKEKTRRAENDAKDVRVFDDGDVSTVVDDVADVSEARGEPAPRSFLLTGATGQRTKPDETAPATPATAAKTGARDEACVELKAVEAQIATAKGQRQFIPPYTPVKRRSGRTPRNVITGIDSEGNRITESFEERRSARVTRREKSTNVASQQAAKLAKLKSRWAELRGRCSE